MESANLWLIHDCYADKGKEDTISFVSQSDHFAFKYNTNPQQLLLSDKNVLCDLHYP